MKTVYNKMGAAAFPFSAVGDDRYRAFVSARGQLLNQSPELRNC